MSPFGRLAQKGRTPLDGASDRDVRPLVKVSRAMSPSMQTVIFLVTSPPSDQSQTATKCRNGGLDHPGTGLPLGTGVAPRPQNPLSILAIPTKAWRARLQHTAAAGRPSLRRDTTPAAGAGENGHWHTARRQAFVPEHLGKRFHATISRSKAMQQRIYPHPTKGFPGCDLVPMCPESGIGERIQTGRPAEEFVAWFSKAPPASLTGPASADGQRRIRSVRTTSTVEWKENSP
jgi:hypothetical protein